MHEGPNYLVLAILFTVPCLPMAIALNKTQREKSPKLRPYTWGYFFGMSGAFAFSVFAVLQVIGDINARGDRAGTSFVFGLSLSIAAVAFALVIRRNKWAFILATIFSMNPAFWIINGFYIRKRWEELGGMPSIPIRAAFRRCSSVDQLLIAGILFWAIAVMAFVFLFEPYGGYLDSRELLHIAKIILFPAMVGVVGRLVFGPIFRRRR